MSESTKTILGLIGFIFVILLVTNIGVEKDRDRDLLMQDSVQIQVMELSVRVDSLCKAIDMYIECREGIPHG